MQSQRFSGPGIAPRVHAEQNTRNETRGAMPTRLNNLGEAVDGLNPGGPATWLQFASHRRANNRAATKKHKALVINTTNCGAKDAGGRSRQKILL
ncbi:hypothetical protein LF1_49610 [Rubripirellula obstinata]|uniref:Uncharacterized protein n=1 Tax=Rubripirellula obstinata TaxID=406547 RepID=A0A5B1CMJ1_9BACT|nr:hypothetical protein LF1_49610 [Rubripirellula obstinata]